MICTKPAPKPSSIIIFNVSRDNIIIESAVCFLESSGHTVQKLASIFSAFTVVVSFNNNYFCFTLSFVESFVLWSKRTCH